MQTAKLKQRESRRGPEWHVRFRLPRVRPGDRRRECWYPLGLVADLNRDDAQRQANDVVAKAGQWRRRDCRMTLLRSGNAGHLRANAVKACSITLASAGFLPCVRIKNGAMHGRAGNVRSAQCWRGKRNKLTPTPPDSRTAARCAAPRSPVCGTPSASPAADCVSLLPPAD